MPANWVESGNLRLQTSSPPSPAFISITITIIIIHDCHYYQYVDEKKIQASPSVGRLTQRRAQDDQLIQVGNKKTGLSRWPKKTGLSRSLLLALYVTMHWYWSNKQVFVLIFCVVFYSFWMKKLS